MHFQRDLSGCSALNAAEGGSEETEASIPVIPQLESLARTDRAVTRTEVMVWEMGQMRDPAWEGEDMGGRVPCDEVPLQGTGRMRR